MPAGLVSGEAFLLGSQQPSSCCDLARPSFSVRAILVSLCLLIKTPVLVDDSFTFMTSFNFSYFLKDIVSKYSHTGA